jgi:hypothetical protein
MGGGLTKPILIDEVSKPLPRLWKDTSYPILKHNNQVEQRCAQHEMNPTIELSSVV